MWPLLHAVDKLQAHDALYGTPAVHTAAGAVVVEDADACSTFGAPLPGVAVPTVADAVPNAAVALLLLEAAEACSASMWDEEEKHAVLLCSLTLVFLVFFFFFLPALPAIVESYHDLNEVTGHKLLLFALPLQLLALASCSRATSLWGMVVGYSEKGVPHTFTALLVC